LVSLRGFRGRLKSSPFIEEISQAWAAKYKVPHYFSVITRPMDLVRIGRTDYADLDALAADVALMTDNCRVFNGSNPASEFVQLANDLDAHFLTRVLPLARARLKARLDHARRGEVLRAMAARAVAGAGV
jgi:hypothetical protein